MKKYLFIAMCGVLALNACTKEFENGSSNADSTANNENGVLVFTASAEDTRITMDEGRKVSFAANDEISIFAKGDATNYRYRTESGGSNATFTPVDAAAPSGADEYYALYPYQSGASISDGVINGVTISSGTEGTGKGKFNSSKGVIVAVSATTDLFFKHVMALLKVTVPAEVTNLKQIYAFNRADSNADKAFTGTVNITPSAIGSPTYTVTTANNQSGMSGPSGSSNPIPEGTYYIPVLPGNATKGIDLKLVYQDGFEGRMFNGNPLDLEAGHVYNLGTIVKTRDFVYNSFENGNLNGEYTGNAGALSVVANPNSSGNNTSSYALVDNMNGSNGSTSGYFTTNISAVKFPSSIRSFYNKLSMKVYLGSNAYYPRFRFNKGTGTDNDQHPARLNGVAISSQGDWDANVITDDWNILEWDASQFSNSGTPRSHFGALSSFELRVFVDWSGSGLGIGTNSDHIVYFDDVVFTLISSF